MRKQYILKVSCIISLLIFGSCSKSEPPKPTPPLKKIAINFSYFPLTTDPRKKSDPVTTTLNLMLYEGLTRLEPDGSISLALAKSIKISDDLKSYTFKLRESLWSDGFPLTAHDFENSWKEVLLPDFNSSTAHLLFPIKNAEAAKSGLLDKSQISVEALDDYTLQVELEYPTPYFLELTAFSTFFPTPSHIKKEDSFPSTSRDKKLISNGPFILESADYDFQLTTKKNPHYWNKEVVKLDQIEIMIIKDEDTALQLFAKGRLDWLGGWISPLPIVAINSLREQNLLKEKLVAGTAFCAFNLDRFPFNNLNIRKAFALAINRKQLIEITQGGELPASSLISPVFTGDKEMEFFVDGSTEDARIHFRKGLEELGISAEDFPTLTYYYFQSELQGKVAEMIQIQLKNALGVKLSLEKREMGTFFSVMHGKDFEIAQVSWIAQYHDQMNILERLKYVDSPKNYASWEHPEYIKILNNSFSISDPEKRKIHLKEAEKILSEELPCAPLYHFSVIYIQNPRLKGVDISPLGDVQFRHAHIESSEEDVAKERPRRPFFTNMQK